MRRVTRSPARKAASWVTALLVTAALSCRRDPSPSEPAKPAPVDLSQRAKARPVAHLDLIQLRSEGLSAFAGHDVNMKALVWTPPSFDPDDAPPALYQIHGFGGSAQKAADRFMTDSNEAPANVTDRPMVVFLDATHNYGHHVFADSPSMGPWATALTQELIPAIDRRYGTPDAARGHYITGHSSGGWSSLWLMIRYPDLFGGVWSTAPDPVDFRDFVGVDIYTFDNAYRTPAGATVQLEYSNGVPMRSLRSFVDGEVALNPVGGQFYSFDAVFSQLGPDGLAVPLFDRETGAIDRAVAESWRRWDISWLLQTQWSRRGPQLDGKLHLFVGTNDTYGLQRPLRLLVDTLSSNGGDAEVLFVEGRDHSNLYEPHPEYYPHGLWARIEREVVASAAR